MDRKTTIPAQKMKAVVSITERRERIAFAKIPMTMRRRA